MKSTERSLICVVYKHIYMILTIRENPLNEIRLME